MLINSFTTMMAVVFSLFVASLFILLTLRIYTRGKTYNRPAFVKLLPVVVATFAAIISGIVSLKSHLDSTYVFDFPGSTYTRDSSRLESRIDLLDQRLKQMSESVAAFQQNTNMPQDSSMLAALQIQADKNASDIKHFEGLLLSDAERIITLPLLKHDLESLKSDITTTKESIKNLSALVAETNGQIRWVIGTLALGILALVIPAIKSLFASPRQE